MIATQSIEYQDKKIVLSATVPLKNQLPNQRTKNTSPPTRVSCPGKVSSWSVQSDMKSLWNIKEHKVDKKWKSLPHIPIIKLTESQKRLLCFSYCYYRVPPQTRTLTKIYFCWQLVIRSYRATCSEPFLFTSVYACVHISGRFPYNIILFQDKTIVF